MKRIKLHISPCPNDTFIFHALLHGLVDCEGLEFNPEFKDIQELNEIAESGQGEVVKVSCATLPLIMERYRLLKCGGALGFGNAPIIVGLSEQCDLQSAKIAIPGWHTTAALLLKNLIKPNPNNLRQYRFDHIADAIIEGEVQAGVLIHEGRFTFKERGLMLIADLGELWDREYNLPIPLGAVVVNRDLGTILADKIERVIQRSVQYAMANPTASAEFVKAHAVELDPEVRQKHIDFFVNQFSVNLGEQGLKAIETLIGEPIVH